MTRLLSLAVLCFVLSLSSVAQPRRGMMTPADILRVANVTDAQISPNGQWVVYTVSSVDDDKNISILWLARVGVDSSPRRPGTYPEWPEVRTPPRPLLPSGWTASNPRWSPDSNSIAFFTTRED